jgi:Na+/H+-translocating membrane pyrophosphatase
VIIINLEQAVKYISNKSEPTNRFHWGLIIIGIFWYLTAVIITWFTLTENTIYVEVNPISKVAFLYLGIIPTCVIMLILITITMIYIPYKFRNNKRIGLACNLALVLFFFLDGGHNAYIYFDWIAPLEVPYRITENVVMYLGL